MTGLRKPVERVAMALEFLIDANAAPVIVRLNGRLTLGPHLRR